MRFRTFLEVRQRGKSLPETGYPDRYVVIFRAADANESTLAGNDEYVTRSEKFAREHADHQAAVNEEPYTVFRYTVLAPDVYEAYNPGEYFYAGPPVQGRGIYTSQPDQY